MQHQSLHWTVVVHGIVVWSYTTGFCLFMLIFSASQNANLGNSFFVKSRWLYLCPHSTQFSLGQIIFSCYGNNAYGNHLILSLPKLIVISTWSACQSVVRMYDMENAFMKLQHTQLQGYFAIDAILTYSTFTILKKTDAERLTFLVCTSSDHRNSSAVSLDLAISFNTNSGRKDICFQCHVSANQQQHHHPLPLMFCRRLARSVCSLKEAKVTKELLSHQQSAWSVRFTTDALTQFVPSSS